MCGDKWLDESYNQTLDTLFANIWNFWDWEFGISTNALSQRPPNFSNLGTNRP